MSFSTSLSTMVQYLERALRQSLKNGIETISKASIETTLYKRRHNNAVPIGLSMLIQCLTRKMSQCLDNDIEILWKSGIESTL